jgi:hypothetical protein
VKERGAEGLWNWSETKMLQQIWLFIQTASKWTDMDGHGRPEGKCKQYMGIRQSDNQNLQELTRIPKTCGDFGMW